MVSFYGLSVEELVDMVEFWLSTLRTGLPYRTAGGIRYTVVSLLDGRTFERFHVDVGLGDPLVEAVEFLAMPALLSFAEIDPVVVPCYPITQQLAEKCHAYIRQYGSGVSSRIKDFVDMILLAEMGAISGQKLTAAIEATFRNARIQDIPNKIPPPAEAWKTGFRRMADEVGLSDYSLESSYWRIQQFLDPILAGEARDLQWNPDSWSWK